MRPLGLFFRLSLFSFLCLSFLSVGCATREEITLIDQRINALETGRQSQTTELKELGKKGESATLQFREKFADFRIKVGRLEKELQLMTGRLDEMSHLMSQVNKQNEAQANLLASMKAETHTLQNRLERMEQYIGLDATKSSAAVPAHQNPSVVKKTGEKELYQEGKDLLDKGKPGEARQKFNAFLKAYPTSDLADNAQFGIGEAYYHEKWYEKSILEYQLVVEKFPSGNKVRGALLKQGLAFDKLGESASARLILKELIKKYPDSTEATIAKKKLGSLKQ